MKKYTSILILLLLSAGGLFFHPAQVLAQDCSQGPQAPQKVTAISGPGSSQVTLFWEESPHADRYAVAFGTASNKYMYGANDIGGEKARSYIVSHLTPGVRYYFRLTAATGCNSSPFSAEVSAVAKGGAGQVAVSAAVPAKAPPKAQVPAGVQTTTYGSKQHLTSVSGPGAGEVTLRWQSADSANDYHLVYGTGAGNYQYGALNIGNTNKYTVKALVPGRRYYFALVPLFENRPLYTTAAVSAVAMGQTAEVIMTTPQALIDPTAQKVVIPTVPETSSPSAVVSVAPQETSVQAQPTAPAGQ